MTDNNANNLEANFTLERTEFDALFEINPAGANWGSITGHIEDQTDLYNILNAKADVSALTALTVTVGDNYTILDGKISALSTTVSNNYTELNGKITTNTDNITSIYNTMNNYGDIVSYNAADFATKNQGLLADSAIQPNNNITLLNNNAGYITNAVNNLANYYLKSETYTKIEVQNLISGITGITIEVVNVLPASGENGVIYLVPKEGASPDVYNEYIWVEADADFELIGNTEIDLTNYVQFTDLATVATSGSYNDLNNKPTIPTVGNGAITINQGGTQKGTFTVNQSGNTTIDLDGNITVDSTLSTISTNPVQNKIITTSLNKKLENTSTGYNSLTVGGISYSSGNTLNVGKGSKAMASWSTALGFSAETRAESAIQLGYGKNYDELTLAVGFVESDTEYEVQNSYNYTLLDGATGLIPDARLSNNIARTTDIGNGTITFTQGGVTKGTITTNQSGNTTIAFDAGGGGAVDSVNGQTGVVVLTASDVGALPDNTTIPSKTSDLTNDSGFITGITSSDVITALTYTPYNGATNPNGYITNSALTGYATETWVVQQGYITGITSSDVTTALGYTPYNSSNPNGYITSADLPTVNNATITFTQGGTTKGTITLNQSTNQTIALDAGSSGGGTWGSITGTLSDQTDLQTALNSKLNTSDITEYTAAEVETLWGSI